jgi:hypothetical protein
VERKLRVNPARRRRRGRPSSRRCMLSPWTRPKGERDTIKDTVPSLNLFLVVVTVRCVRRIVIQCVVPQLSMLIGVALLVVGPVARPHGHYIVALLLYRPNLKGPPYLRQSVMSFHRLYRIPLALWSRPGRKQVMFCSSCFLPAYRGHVLFFCFLFALTPIML